MEVFQGEQKIDSKCICGPVTAAQAKAALNDIQEQWIGKLTASNSNTILVGDHQLNPGTTYHLHLRQQAGMYCNTAPADVCLYTDATVLFTTLLQYKLSCPDAVPQFMLLPFVTARLSFQQYSACVPLVTAFVVYSTDTSALKGTQAMASIGAWPRLHSTIKISQPVLRSRFMAAKAVRAKAVKDWLLHRACCFVRAGCVASKLG